MWRRRPDLRPRYDVVIIGGGSHGLATAYYLRQHGITDVAVLEKGYNGSGAAGGNTTIPPPDYKTPGGGGFSDAPGKASEGPGRGRGFNRLFSPGGPPPPAPPDP